VIHEFLFKHGFVVFFRYLQYMALGAVEEEACIFPTPEALQDIFRPPVDCSSCGNVTGVDVVTNLSHVRLLLLIFVLLSASFRSIFMASFLFAIFVYNFFQVSLNKNP